MAHHVISDDVTGQDELGRDFVELHELAGDDRVVLTIDRAVLQRSIKLGVGDRRRIGAKRFTGGTARTRPVACVA